VRLKGAHIEWTPSDSARLERAATPSKRAHSSGASAPWARTLVDHFRNDQTFYQCRAGTNLPRFDVKPPVKPNVKHQLELDTSVLHSQPRHGLPTVRGELRQVFVQRGP
jgi:hypothetical protein